MRRQFHIAAPTVNAFHRALTRWYRQHRRDLPWRRTRDPYAIWVSEIMLQQTRVETVIPYYRRWLRAFPTAAALARAPLARVLKLWEGLGYYTRARNLHRAARQFVFCVVRSYQKKDTLMRLPGVGRYTAGAIASMAFGERAAVVDGNVARVLARVFGITANVQRPATLRRLWGLAEALLPVARCGEFNQALMELGALVCVPGTPRCEDCPLRRVCSARATGRQNRLPNRGRRRVMESVMQDVAWCCRDGHVRLRQRPATGLLAGLWELPPAVAGSETPLLTLRHTIMNRRITLRVFAVDGAAGEWVSRRRLAHLPMPAAHRRAVAQLVAEPGGNGAGGVGVAEAARSC